MKIREEVHINLTPNEVREILKEHFKGKYDIDSVYFNVDGVEDPTDWRAEYPLSHEMTEVRIIAKNK